MQEKQQLQSDLLESQTRIHELERMIDYSGQVIAEPLSLFFCSFLIIYFEQGFDRFNLFIASS